MTQSESPFFIVVPPTAPMIDLAARSEDKETQMNQEVAEKESDVGPADLVVGAGLRHVVGEAH